MEFPVRHIIQATESSVNNCHIDFRRDLTCRHTAYRSSIDTYLAFNSQVCSQKVIDRLNIFLKLLWRRASLGSSVSTIVPYPNINAFIKEEI